MTTTIHGIRHHGPGSARSLVAALEQGRPDLVLVEGPPDADALIPLAGHPEMKPPVALVVHVAAKPGRAVFYPFAEFSPEWQAMRFALAHDVPVRFMDLPRRHALAGEDEEPRGPAVDPLDLLARAAGYPGGESWWEAMVEERRDGADLFAGVSEVMTALREEVEREGGPPDPGEIRREASMRRILRKAEREGFERIAVVCGAWHAPALVDRPPVREDDAVLRGLPRIKVEATWIPWTDDRLARRSGYGAGVDSPGWYRHLFVTTDRLESRWLTRAARVLRAEGIDVSPAHVIEAVRLAQATAALRERAAPGLSEMNEAIRTVMLGGEERPLDLIRRALVVGERLGAIPEETPQVPLARDVERQARRLRLVRSSVEKDLVLDLRKPTGLGRSVLLRRLRILGVTWGEPGEAVGTRGTFKESWRICWKPELAVRLIEAARYGPTVERAAAACVGETAAETDRVAKLARWLEQVLRADLPGAVETLVRRIEDLSATTGDVTQFLEALPPLARILRYGDVRGTDAEPVARILGTLLARTAAGLTLVTRGLDDEAAAEMTARLDAAHRAVTLLEREEWRDSWLDALAPLAEDGEVAGRLRGRFTRLLGDAGRSSKDELARRMSFALSPAEEPAVAAAWLAGFLGAEGEILLHDEVVLSLVDGFVAGMTSDAFVALLPALRRTFAAFPAPVRRRLGEALAGGARGGRRRRGGAAEEHDRERADAALPVLARILGG